MAEDDSGPAFPAHECEGADGDVYYSLEDEEWCLHRGPVLPPVWIKFCPFCGVKLSDNNG